MGNDARAVREMRLAYLFLHLAAQKVLQRLCHVVGALDEAPVHAADDVILMGKRRREVGHGRVVVLLLEPGLCKGPNHVLEAVHVVDHHDKVVEARVHDDRGFRLCGAAHVNAILAVGARETAHGEPGDHADWRVHGGDNLGADSR